MTSATPQSPQVPEDNAAHLPVLLAETVRLLAPAAGRRVLDCTLGLGGHAQALLAAGASVLGIDRDPLARTAAARRLQQYGAAFALRSGTFGDVAESLVLEGEVFHGVLADLGVSSMQLDDEGRGFSIRSDAPIDMRMGDGCSEDALGLIDRLSEDELADVIFTYGEERLSRRIARGLKFDRAQGRLTSGADLAAAVRRMVPGHQPRHPALRTFQALRIAVNDELGQLTRLLDLLPYLLQPGGMAVVISFHSLEDRAVKRSFRSQSQAGAYSDTARRVIEAQPEECELNPRATSAKLRWALAASRPTPRHPQAGPPPNPTSPSSESTP